MLLDGIYYGKIPICRAYKDGSIIWSLGEEKNLVFNLDFGPCVMAQITPEAAKIVAKEYRLNLDNQILISNDSIESIPVQQIVFNNLDAVLEMQGPISLTPLGMTFIFDVVGNSSESEQIFFQQAFSDGFAIDASLGKTDVININEIENFTKDKIELSVDPSEKVSISDQQNEYSSALADVRHSRPVKSIENLALKEQVEGKTLRTRFFYAYSPLNKKTIVNLINGVSKILSFQRQISALFQNSMDALNSEATILSLQNQLETDEFINNNESKSINTDLNAKFEINNKANNDVSKSVYNDVQSTLLVSAFSDLSDTQNIQAEAPSSFYTISFYKNTHSQCVIAEWPAALGTINQIDTSKTALYNQNEKVGISNLIDGTNVKSNNVVSEKTFSINGDKELASSTSRKITEGLPINTQSLNFFYLQPSEFVNYQKSFGDLFELDLNSSLVRPLNLLKVSEFLSDSTFSASPEQRVYVDDKITSKNEQNLFISSGLAAKFKNDFVANTEADLEIYEFLTTGFDHLLTSASRAALEQANKVELSLIRQNYFDNDSYLNADEQKGLTNISAICTTGQQAILTLISWEYPIKTETNLFISQALQVIPNSGELVIK